jgi:hypothetical protein
MMFQQNFPILWINKMYSFNLIRKYNRVKFIEKKYKSLKKNKKIFFYRIIKYCVKKF